MKKNIFLWGLYDFSNSLLMAALVGLYFSQWVVIDNGFDDIWYGGTFVLATILLLFTSPFWGAWSDRIGKRMPFLIWTTIFLIICGGLFVLTIHSSLQRFSKVILALFFFLLIQYGFQLSLVFTNALLTRLSKPETRGKISGIGEFFNEMGWLIGPVILLPFAAGSSTLIGEPGRSQVFLPAVVFFALFSLPMLFWFKEPPAENSVKTDFREVYKKTISGFRELFHKEKNVAIFLVAFCLISDAMLTIELYFAIFLDFAYKITDSKKVLILALMQFFTIPSAYFLGKISDKYGPKKVLFFICAAIIVALSAVLLSSSVGILYPVAVLAGLGWGGFYAATRAFLVKISPASNIGEYFGFFATFQRFSSIIGPLIWGGITLAMKNYGVIKYRLAGLSLVAVMIIGTFLLKYVKEKREENILA